MSTASTIMALAGVVIREMIRRKDIYVLFTLSAVMTLALGTANFFGDEKITGYLKDFGLLVIWISSLVIAVNATARQMPAERESRTIFPLLAKPVTRAQVLVGKFFGCWLASGISLVVFYTFFALVTGSREQALPGMSFYQAAWAHWMMLAIICGMVLLGSLVFAAPSSNATICYVVILGILGLAGDFNKLALGLPEPMQTVVYGIYYLVPHLEFFDMRALVIHGLPPAPWIPWLWLNVYAGIYATMFVWAAGIVFNRQSLEA